MKIRHTQRARAPAGGYNLKGPENIDEPTQHGKLDSAYAALEYIDRLYGGTRTQSDFKALNDGKDGVTDIPELHSKAKLSYEKNKSLSNIGRAMNRGEATLLKEKLPNGYGHAVVPKKIQLWSIRNKAVIKTWVMDPSSGSTSYRPTSFWKNLANGHLIRRP